MRNDQFAGSDFSAGDQFIGGSGVDTLWFNGNFTNAVQFDPYRYDHRVRYRTNSCRPSRPPDLFSANSILVGDSELSFRLVGTGTLDLTGDHYYGGDIQMGDGDDTVTSPATHWLAVGFLAAAAMIT